MKALQAPPVTGTSVLRQACAARNRKLNLAVMAREELRISPEALHRFIAGDDLPADVLERLAQSLWGGTVEYDLDTDRLRPGRRAETLPSPIRPDPVKPSVEHLVARQRLRVPPGMPSQIASKSRPGWAE